MKNLLKAPLSAIALVCLLVIVPRMAHAQTAVDWEATAGGAFANPWVQKKNCPNVTPNGSHVATCAFTSNVTSGDKEVALVFVNSGTIAINSASGSNCGSMSAKGSPTLASPSTSGFVCTAGSSAAETISVTLASGTPSTTIELFEIPSSYVYDTVGTVTTGSQSSTSVSLGSGTTDASELLIGGIGVGGASVAKTGINVQCNDVGDDGTTTPSSYFFTTVSGAVGQQPTCTVTTTASHATNGIMLSFESPIQPLIVPDGTPQSSTPSTGGTVTLPSGLTGSNHCFVASCSNLNANSTISISGGGDTWTQASSYLWSIVEGQTNVWPSVMYIAHDSGSGTAPTITFGGGGDSYCITVASIPPAGSTCPLVGSSAGLSNGFNATIVGAAGTATATTVANLPSWVKTGDTVTLGACSGTQFSGGTITVTGANTFTYSSATTGTGTSCAVYDTTNTVIWAPSNAGVTAGSLNVWWFSLYDTLAVTFSSPQPQNGNPLLSMSSGDFRGHVGVYPNTAVGSSTLSQYGVVPSDNSDANGGGQVLTISAATPTASPTPTATATATATATSTGGTPTPTATATPTVTATLTPTPSATATATNTATPSLTPTPSSTSTPGPCRHGGFINREGRRKHIVPGCAMLLDWARRLV